jgi:hypothetical protein
MPQKKASFTASVSLKRSGLSATSTEHSSGKSSISAIVGSPLADDSVGPRHLQCSAFTTSTTREARAIKKRSMAKLARRGSYQTSSTPQARGGSASTLRAWAQSFRSLCRHDSQRSRGLGKRGPIPYHQGSFAEDVSMMAAHLHKVHRSTCFVVSPDTEERQLWDVVVALAIVFTAIVVPLEVAAMSDEQFGSPSAPFYWVPAQPFHPRMHDASVASRATDVPQVNRALDMLFLSDICVNCFTAYVTRSTRAALCRVLLVIRECRYRYLRTEQGGDSAWERRVQYVPRSNSAPCVPTLHHTEGVQLCDVVTGTSSCTIRARGCSSTWWRPCRMTCSPRAHA